VAQKTEKRNMLNLYLIRHGENKANLTKEFSYKKVDYPLTEKGILQAEQTAEYIKNIGFNCIYSSPMKRAIETASIIEKQINKPICILEQFREVNVGNLEDLPPTKENWSVFLNIVDQWIIGRHEISFPDGENCTELSNRFIHGMKEIIDNKTDGNILVVGHGMNFVQGVMELAKIENRREFYKIKNYNCSISSIEIENHVDGLKAKVIEWASIKHLYGLAAEVNEPMMIIDK
jgi:broad specificity phosphatase PhoE